MNKKLEHALCVKYPEIFRDKNAPMQQTAMFWGFECQDGWYALIDGLCEHLMRPVNQAREAVGHAEIVDSVSDNAAKYRAKLAELETQIPVAMQVKEKFGTLRFYAYNCNDTQEMIIEFAESLSARICEDCGATQTVKTYREGWHRTLCDACAEKDGRVVIHAEETPSGVVVNDNDLWGV
jgi:hypothetical protein